MAAAAMKRRRLVTAVLGLGIAASAAPAAMLPNAAAAPAVASHGTTVGVKRDKGHQVLEAGGRFVYVHVNSKGKNVPCTAGCLNVWPNVTSARKPHPTDGVKGKHLAVTKHHDVTYFGHRLYYFAYDLAGRSFGDHASSFGGTWRLINVSGKLA
jgi:predicted lipoprotein with Yx(FWY)xxD motif